jgi:soluble lytic murein transglycosylase-like protein
MKRCKTLCLLILLAFAFVAEAPGFGRAGDSFRPSDAISEKSYVVIGSISRNIFGDPPVHLGCGFRKRTNYSNIVVPLSHKYGVDWRLITAIMAAESGFNPCAVSPKGAIGLMQISPELAAQYKIHGKEMFDPAKNVRAGILHVKRLSKMFNGDLELTVAAYNAGEGNVARYGGVPPFKETQDYVKKVLDYQSDLQSAETSVRTVSLLPSR